MSQNGVDETSMNFDIDTECDSNLNTEQHFQTFLD